MCCDLQTEPRGPRGPGEQVLPRGSLGRVQEGPDPARLNTPLPRDLEGPSGDRRFLTGSFLAAADDKHKTDLALRGRRFSMRGEKIRVEWLQCGLRLRRCRDDGLCQTDLGMKLAQAIRQRLLWGLGRS